MSREVPTPRCGRPPPTRRKSMRHKRQCHSWLTPLFVRSPLGGPPGGRGSSRAASVRKINLGTSKGVRNEWHCRLWRMDLRRLGGGRPPRGAATSRGSAEDIHGWSLRPVERRHSRRHSRTRSARTASGRHRCSLSKIQRGASIRLGLGVDAGNCAWWGTFLSLKSRPTGPSLVTVTGQY